jgi:hypothetical protein
MPPIATISSQLSVIVLSPSIEIQNFETKQAICLLSCSLLSIDRENFVRTGEFFLQSSTNTNK